MTNKEVQNIVVAYAECCKLQNTLLSLKNDNLDEWKLAIDDCCEQFHLKADEIIEQLDIWASEWETTYTDFLCELADPSITTTTIPVSTTTTTIPVTTTTTTIDPNQIDWSIVFENFLCQQEDNPFVTTTTTIPLKSGTIDYSESEYIDFLCAKEDNPLVSTTTTTGPVTTSTTTVAPDDIQWISEYTDYLCGKEDNPLVSTTTTTVPIDEDDIDWSIVFENFLCQQEDVVTTTTTTTTAPITTTTTTISTACGIEINGEKVFPEIHNIDLGSATGIVTLNIDAISAPDKFTVEWNGSEVINTGYRGDSSFQDELYSALAAEGAPSEAIVGGAVDSFSFNKNVASPIAIVKIYAPIDETKWNFILTCPDSSTTTTISPVEVEYESEYDNYLCEQEDNPLITTTTTTAIPTTTTTTAPVTTTTTTIAVYGINCGDPASGGAAYPMEIYITEMGAGTGYVTLNYDAESIPDKFIVEMDGIEVLNTGYVGDSALQSALDAALTALGEPTETIQGPGVGSATFFKSSSTTIAVVKVFAPMEETAWGFTLTCPDGGTTTTTTTAAATTTTTTIAPTTTTTTTNAPPISQNNTIDSGRSTGVCSVSKIITPSDFSFTDAEGDVLEYVEIDSYTLSGAGTLTYKNKTVNDGDILRVFGGASGSFQHTLEYIPDAVNLSAYSDAINFSVRTADSTVYSNISILTVDNNNCGPVTTTTTTVPVTTTTTSAPPVTTTTTTSSAFVDEGLLYNFHSIESLSNVAPENFRVATLDDIVSLVDYVGGDTVAGGKLKATDTWSNPNTGATDEYGFTSLPSGKRYIDGTFLNRLIQGNIWIDNR